jgi:PAS domain S-box-containing protein
MRVASKLAVQLLDVTAGLGLRREELLAGLPVNGPSLTKPGSTIEWEAFASILERVWTKRGSDPERMREVGRALARAPSYSFLKRLARTAVSPHALYDAGYRWLAPASFPHLSLHQAFVTRDRLRIIASIPEPHAPSAPFFYTFEGVLTELPTFLGLPRATIAKSRVTPRTIEVDIDLPRTASVFARLRRRIRATVRAAETLDLLEEQRRELADGLEAVQRSTVEIHELFARLPDLVIIHRAGTILWSNRATATALGYDDCDELVGRSVLDLVPPAYHDMVAQRMREVDSANMPDLVESSLVTRDGTTLLVEVSPTQLVTFGGSAARLLVARDITERVRLQQQLLTADRMASIGMLAAGVAHEVNNPLAYVLNNVEIAMKQLAPLGATTHQSREALAVALEGVDRIRTIVRDLLVLSRVDDVSLGPVDVRAVVESTLALAAQKIAERAELDVEYRTVPAVRATPARLGQVLLNLLANALESMPAASRATNKLRVVVRAAPGGGALVEVTDNGCGVLPEHRNRIFDPFFTTKASGSGTGLGLAISQRLVTEIGGELTFDSTLMRGSTFRVKLPAADVDDRTTDQAPISAWRSG